MANEFISVETVGVDITRTGDGTKWFRWHRDEGPKDIRYGRLTSDGEEVAFKADGTVHEGWGAGWYFELHPDLWIPTTDPFASGEIGSKADKIESDYDKLSVAYRRRLRRRKGKPKRTPQTFRGCLGTVFVREQINAE